MFVLSGADRHILRRIRGRKEIGFRKGRFGCSLAPIGDIDGDHAAEFAISAEGILDLGEVWFVAGRAIERSRTVLRSRAGIRGLDSVLARIGDHDGDGVADLLVGDPSCDGPANTYGECSGAVEILSSKSGKLFVRVDCPQGLDRFGSAVAAIGDVDRDGVEDFVAHAILTSIGDGQANFRLHSAKTGALLREIRP